MRSRTIKDVNVRVFREKDGTWAAACSELGVYATGATQNEVRKNFADALDAHLEVIRQYAMAAVYSTA